MEARLVPLALVLLAVLVTWWSWSARDLIDRRDAGEATPTASEILDGVQVRRELVENGKSLEPAQIIKVTDGVYVAFGFAIANSILLEGPTGLIVVDTTECLECAKKIHQEFRRISNKPISAIVFTHFHGDHVYGAEAFIEDDQHPPDIWGHELLAGFIRDIFRLTQKYFRGSLLQFGDQIGDQVFTAGLGRRLLQDPVRVTLSPTKLFKGDIMHLELAGMNVTLLHVPGETKDQMAVWLPDKRVLLPGDDIYRTFPNLYAIRGTPPRDAVVWHDSLKKMRNLNARYLVPSHTKPVAGQHEIHDLFTVYMAGIRYVHDQTVRHMNEGLHPDEIAQRIALPRSLASHDYLQQFYGTTAWSAKAVYENYVGWFSGDPVDLFPHSPREKADYMLELVGESKLLSRAESALNDDDARWALELSSYVFTAEPTNQRARELRLRALRRLASQQTNPCARNFYLTHALSDHKLVKWHIDETRVIAGLQMSEVLYLMKYRLKAEMTDGVNMTVVFCFEDIEESFRLQILYSVLTIDPLPSSDKNVTSVDGSTVRHQREDDGSTVRHQREDDEARLMTTSRVWRDVVAKRRSLPSAYSKGLVKISEGDVARVHTFVSYFAF